MRKLEGLTRSQILGISASASLGLSCDLVFCPPLRPYHVAGAPEKYKHCYERESEPFHNDLLGYRFHVLLCWNVPNDR